MKRYSLNGLLDLATSLGFVGVDCDWHDAPNDHMVYRWPDTAAPPVLVLHVGFKPGGRDFKGYRSVIHLGGTHPHMRARCSSAYAAYWMSAGVDFHTCNACAKPFDPADRKHDGAARFADTKFCRACTDRCMDSEIADHRCTVCA